MSRPKSHDRPHDRPHDKPHDTGSVPAPGETDDILERNVEQLLAGAHEPPIMDPEARQRVLARLKQRLPQPAPEPKDSAEPKARGRTPRAWWSWRLGLAGGALAAAVAMILIVMRLGGDGASGAQSYENPGPGPERVTLVDGTELVLDRDTRVVVTGARSMRLERGEVLLDVARAVTPFEVVAPHGRIVVLGTRFVVGVEDATTLASVIRGRVRVENEHGEAILGAGEQGVLAQDTRPVRRSAPRLSHLASWARLARRQDEMAATAPMRKGILVARNPQWQVQDYPLPLRELNVDVHVENQIARVAVDQTFFNAQPMDLEGVYSFPLPPDAAISRLAMYVAGQRMEAAVVERVRGRQIYESIVYRRRDPALLEWMAGNLFQVRIFPLPARQEKRIVLSYTQALSRLYDDVHLEVPIPDVEASVEKVRYRVTLVGCGRCEVSSTSHELEVRRQGDDVIVSFAKQDHVIGDDLLLRVRDDVRGGRVAMFESAGAAESAGHEGTRYWMMRAQPDMPEHAAVRRPRRYVIVHDTSASRGALERKAQRYVIERLLDELDEYDEVAVLAFDATVRQWAGAFQRVGTVERRDVARFLAEESRDGIGHTDLGAALTSAVDLLGAADGDFEPYILYLGDGVVTAEHGDDVLARLRQIVAGKATLVAVAVGEHMDATLLSGLAAATGGMFTTMNPGDDLAWRAFDLIAALNTPRVVDVHAVLLDATGQPMPVAAYASAAQIAEGEAIDVVARWPATGNDRNDGAWPAAVELRGVYAGEPWTRRIALDDAGRNDVAVQRDAAYLPRLWAMRRVAALMSEGAEAHRDEITALGQEHFLMTPFTSLLVLENDAMYRQYKVARNRTPAWAAYALPDRIEVVHEPLDQVAAVDRDAVMVRSPIELLQDSYSMSFAGLDMNGMVLGGALGTREPRMELARSAGVLSVLGNADRGGEGTWSLTGSLAGPFAMDTEAAADPMESTGEDSSAQSVITTSEMRAQPMSWSSNKSDERKQAASTRGPKLQQDPGWGRGMRLGTVGHGSGSGGGLGYLGYHRYYGMAALLPRALHYHSDPRLDDISEHVPGLFEDAIDGQARELRASASAGQGGSITKEARALIEQVRARQGAATYRGQDQAVRVDAQGRFEVERTLPSGLVEVITYDGTWLVHRYAELGLATRRRVDDVEAVLYDHWLPFRVPSAGALSRWYHVSIANPGTLRLSASRAADAAYMEIELDQDLRVIEVRTSAGAGAEPVVARRFERQGDTLVLIEGDERARNDTVLTVLDGQPVQLDGAGDASFTVVDMPLRQPGTWIERAGHSADGSAEWRHVQAQILASHAALGHSAELWQTLQAISAHGKIRVGELVLASGGVRTAGDRASVSRMSQHLIAAGDAASPGSAVARYVVASYKLARSYNGDDFAELARATAAQRSLIAMLSRYRSVLLDIASQGSPSGVDRRAIALVAGYPASPLAYIAAYTFGARWAWQAPDRAVAVWDALHSGPWAEIAAFEAARVRYHARHYDDAAERFERLFASDVASTTGMRLRVDGVVASALASSSRGRAGWRRFWGDWRDRMLDSGDPGRLADLIRAALDSGEHGDLDRVVARVTQLELRRPDHAQILVDALMAAERDAAAMTLLGPWLEPDAAHSTAGPAQLGALEARASLIAERQGRHADAARFLAQAMERDPATELTVVRGQYRRLIGLHTRVAQAHSGAQRRQAVDSALAAVAAWRELDPQNPELDRLAATLLYSLGQPETAWRYLSTAIERAPMDGDSYRVVAEVLEAEGRLDAAEPLWRRAATVDPTNPTWLLRRAQALTALGQRDQARALLDQITSNKWHERFAGVVGQARNLARR